MTWLETLIQTISAYREVAYAFVFLIALLESLPVIGLFVPGATLIVGLALLVPSGAVGLVPMLIAATSGSIAGDVSAFVVGRHFGADLRKWGPVARRPDMMAQAERFFSRHGGKSILLGRFTPPLRGIIPAIAGATDVTWSRFAVAALAAALLWGPAHVVPGALIGASLHLAGAVTGRLGALLLLILASAYLLIVVVRSALRWGVPAMATAIRRVIVWANAHNSVFGREALALLDPEHKEARALAVMAGLLIIGGGLFIAILENLVAGDPLVRADAAIFHALQSMRTGWGDAVMIAITELGDAPVTVPVALAGLLWLSWRRAWVDAAYWTGAIVVSQAVATVIKMALQTPRPIPELYQGWSAFSFPSGHATVNAVVYAFLAVMVARRARPAARSVIVVALGLLIGMIALSRLYLGAHWFSDVAGGLAFGLAWVGLLGIAYTRHRQPDPQTKGLLPVVMVTLIVAGTINIGLRHEIDLARYRPPLEESTIAAPDWIGGSWRTLPSHRIDLGGEIEEPFVLQWAGTASGLATLLRNTGWQSPPVWNASGWMAWVSSTPKPDTLPVLPKLHDGIAPALTLIHPHPDDRSRLVLRLWDSNVRLVGAEAAPTLWLATATVETLHFPLDLLAVATTQRDANTPRDILAGALPALVRELDVRPTGDADWDGVLLLAGGPAGMPAD